jgi:hypothetical protein
MKITILGTGNVGATLGKKWAAVGHAVKFGVRNVSDSKHQTLLSSIAGYASVASMGEAITFGEVIVFAVPGAAVGEIAAQFGGTLGRRIIIDATNRVGQTELNSISIIAAEAPQAKFFRAFNSLGWENFEQPIFGDTQVDLIYCGDSGQARVAVEQLIADIGLRPIYIGNLEQLPVVDNLAKLWFALVFGQKYSRRLAFKVLTE